jgi:hypothetical protein
MYKAEENEYVDMNTWRRYMHILCTYMETKRRLVPAYGQGQRAKWTVGSKIILEMLKVFLSDGGHYMDVNLVKTHQLQTLNGYSFICVNCISELG